MTHRLGRMSSTWVVNAALRLRDLEDVPESMIFGLGASAWYRLEQRPLPVLRCFHPDRIKQSFYAMNVYAVRFNYLSSDALAQVRERTRQGVTTIISLDYFALPATLRADAAEARACTLDYAMLVHRDKEGSDDNVFWLQGAIDLAPTAVDQNTLMRAWFQADTGRSEQCPMATFYWHPVLNLSWQAEAAITQALQRYSAQMQHRFETLGATGLHALAKVFALLEQGDISVLDATARCAAADGGLTMGRELMAEFIAMAAEKLHSAALTPVALHFEQIAHLWRELLQSYLTNAGNAAQYAQIVRAILGHERAAIDAIDQCLATRTARDLGATQQSDQARHALAKHASQTGHICVN
jgi:hypothetical protein